ncbi:MAG: hypothetical protein AAGF95_31785 [Chloroflexota bacterium]
MYQSRIEIPLIASEWQSLLDQDPMRAQRRYLYHVMLVSDPTSLFRPSIGAFQQIARRTPYHFLARASKRLPALLSSPIDEVWYDLSKHSYEHHNSYLQFTGPQVILQQIAHNVRILNAQAQQAGMALFTSSTKTTRASLKQMINRLVEHPAPEKRNDGTEHARIRAHWQLEVARLAIILEELSLEDRLLVVRATDFQSSLTPYLNEQDWSALLYSKPHVAHQQYQLLVDEQKQGTENIPFNLGESIAAFQAVS